MICKHIYRYTQLNDQMVLFLTILFGMSKLISSKYCYVSLKIQLNISPLITQLSDQTVLLQRIKFGISHLCALRLNVKQFYWTLSFTTTSGQCGPGSNGNEEVLCILQSSSITGASSTDCLESYPGHLLVGILPLYKDAVGVFFCPSRLGCNIFWSSF